MPGRRRAPNPDVSIEADLRRQLHLRLAYRAVTKALKPVLAELAQRTIDDVRNDEDAIKESDEHDRVQTELDALLSERLRVVENERRIKAAHLEAQMKAHKEVLEVQYLVSPEFFVLPL